MGKTERPPFLANPEKYKAWRRTAAVIQWLKTLGRGGRWCEVGVAAGVFSEIIRDVCSPDELYLVDPWEMPPADYAGGDVFKTITKEELAGWRARVERNLERFDNVFVYETTSVEAAKKFEPRYFDVVYIDANHSYDAALADLNAWHRTVREGGSLCGHDFVDGHDFIEVPRAVRDFCEAHPEWYLASVTKEKWPSFQLQRR